MPHPKFQSRGEGFPGKILFTPKTWTDKKKTKGGGREKKKGLLSQKKKKKLKTKVPSWGRKKMRKFFVCRWGKPPRGQHTPRATFFGASGPGPGGGEQTLFKRGEGPFLRSPPTVQLQFPRMGRKGMGPPRAKGRGPPGGAWANGDKQGGAGGAGKFGKD